jgi:acyl-coenzyme A synthetase/AMP-(fatty) acid ligase
MVAITVDPERYRNTYWSKFAEQGYYFAGDGARFDPDGAIWVLGRIDDVMKRGRAPHLHCRGGIGARGPPRGR